MKGCFGALGFLGKRRVFILFGLNPNSIKIVRGGGGGQLKGNGNDGNEIKILFCVQLCTIRC